MQDASHALHVAAESEHVRSSTIVVYQMRAGAGLVSHKNEGGLRNPTQPVQAGTSEGERVILRLARPDLLGDLDLLILTVRFRFRISACEPCESASDEGDLRLRTRMGLRELLGDLRRRRGGVRERDSLDDGELVFLFGFGVTEREVSRGNLLLSLLGDQDLSLRRGFGDLESAEGERRARRFGGEFERPYEGDLRVRRRGGDRERSEEGERRLRRGGGEAERLPDGERRRSRDLSRRPPRPRLGPPPGTYTSRSRRGGGDRRRLVEVSNCSKPLKASHTAEIEIRGVVGRDQYLYLSRGLHLCDHRHGNRLCVHAQSARADRDVVIGLDALHARFGGRIRSYRSALVLRGGVVRRRLLKSAAGISDRSWLLTRMSHLFLLQLTLLCL